MRLQKNGEAYRTKYEWYYVDWSQPTTVIADQLGVRPQMVGNARKRYAPETVGKIRIKKEKP